MNWIELKNEPPPPLTVVLGYNKNWIDEDYEPEGIRETFMQDDGTFLSARWNNSMDEWITDDTTKPTHWMQRPTPPSEEQEAIQSQAGHDRWIPVGEQLPEVGEYVLIYEPFPDRNHPECDTWAVSLYNGKNPPNGKAAQYHYEWPDGQDEQPSGYSPTHWQPIPKAPKK